MTDIWVCSTCRSVNRQRNASCYKCGSPASAASGEGSTLRVENAIASRSSVRYRSAWLRGLLASSFILIVTALGVVAVLVSLEMAAWLRDQLSLLVAGGTFDTVQLAERAAPAVQIGLFRFGALLLAVLFFAAWLSRVVMNIPALGGGVPSTTPTKAFIYPLIPILNLVKVPGMIQDALYRVDPRAGGFFMVALAWFGLVGSWILGFLAGWALDIKLAGDLADAAGPDEIETALLTFFDLGVGLEVIQTALVALGSLVLIGLMIRIERRSRARDLEIRAALEIGPVSPTPRPVPTPLPGNGPHLTIKVGDGREIVAELDGESEALSIHELRKAAAALAGVGGSASIHLESSGDSERAVAREAVSILGNAGVPTTFANG